MVDDNFAERFATYNVQQLIDAFNREVGNAGWVSARARFLSALREALLATGLDCSAFITKERMSLASRIRRHGERVVLVSRVED